MTLESLSCPEVATSVARGKQNIWKNSFLQDTNPLKTGVEVCRAITELKTLLFLPRG